MYQAIFKKGYTQGYAEGVALGVAQLTLLRLGAKRFGPASLDVESVIHAIFDQARLNRLTAHILEATSWDELVATP